MGAPLQRIGDPPGMQPDESYPCAACAGEAARRAVHDGIYDIKHADAIPEKARCEFEERFGAVIVEMADWADEYATDAARRDDHEPCERHRPTKGDDE